MEGTQPRLWVGVTAIGDAYLARHRRAASQRLAAVATSDLQVVEAANRFPCCSVCSGWCCRQCAIPCHASTPPPPPASAVDCSPLPKTRPPRASAGPCLRWTSTSSLSLAMPRSPAQATTRCRDCPPGPHANASRSRSVPDRTPRGRRNALVSRASFSMFNSGDRRAGTRGK